MKAAPSAVKRKVGEQRVALMDGPFRYGASSKDISNHRKFARRMLGAVFSQDDNAEHILSQVCPTVEESHDNAEQKYKRKWVEEYKGHLEDHYSTARCAQAKYQGNTSDRGYDRMRRVMTSGNYNEETDGYKMVDFMIDDGKKEGVGLAQWVRRHRIAKHRHENAEHLGVKPLMDDGSVVAGVEYEHSIEMDCTRKGKEWCKAKAKAKSKVEVITSGDAAQSLRKKKLTHMCCRTIGTNYDDNSPWVLWGLRHWEGSDDWESIEAQCEGIFAGMRKLALDNKKVLLFGNENVTVEIDQLWSGDGAFLDAEEGGSGFGAEENCFICCCPRSMLVEDKTYHLKTRKYLNNGSHLPEVWPCEEATFVPFTCPHCSKKITSLSQVQRLFREHNTGTFLSDFKKSHKGKQYLHYKLAPIDTDSTLVDIMHMLMRCVAHNWSHGVAKYIDGDDGNAIADEVNRLLHEKCKVCIDVKKVSSGLQQDAAREP